MFTNQCILENARDLQTDFFLPTGIHTNDWVFRSHLYHIWFQKTFQTHILRWQAKPALSASLSLLLPSALHFVWGFHILWHNTARVSTLLTILSLFSVFSTILEQLSIDYWYRDVIPMSRDKITTLNSNHSSQSTPVLVKQMSPQQRNSTAEQGVKQLSVLNLWVLCYLPAGHNSNVTNIGVPTDQHHTAQWWQNCWGCQQTCSSRPPVFVDSWH